MRLLIDISTHPHGVEFSLTIEKSDVLPNKLEMAAACAVKDVLKNNIPSIVAALQGIGYSSHDGEAKVN